MKAPVDETTEQLPDISREDPTNPRMQRPQSEPKAVAKPLAEQSKKSGGGGLAVLVIMAALAGLGFLAFRALQEVQSGPEQVSTELQPIAPPEETGEGPPPHLAGAVLSAQPDPQPTTADAPADAPPATSEPEVRPPEDVPVKVAEEKPPEPKLEPRKIAKKTADQPTGTSRKAETTTKVAGAGDIGSLRVVTTHSSEPLWATLFVDGKRKGDTPLTFDLSSGPHTIALERGGFKRIEKQVSVASGDVTVVKLELEKDGS